MGKYKKKGNKKSYDNKTKIAILYSYDHECGKSPSKTAKKHNVPQSTISTWLKKDKMELSLMLVLLALKQPYPYWWKMTLLTL